MVVRSPWNWSAAWPQEFRTGRGGLPRQSIDIIDEDVQAHGGATDSRRCAEEWSLGVAQHDGGALNLDLGVHDAPVGAVEAEQLFGTEGSGVEVDRVRGAVDHDVGDDSVAVVLGNGGLGNDGLGNDGLGHGNCLLGRLLPMALKVEAEPHLRSSVDQLATEQSAVRSHSLIAATVTAPTSLTEPSRRSRYAVGPAPEPLQAAPVMSVNSTSQALDLNQARGRTISWSGPQEAELGDEGQANEGSDRMDQEELPCAREQEA